VVKLKPLQNVKVNKTNRSCNKTPGICVCSLWTQSLQTQLPQYPRRKRLHAQGPHPPTQHIAPYRLTGTPYEAKPFSVSVAGWISKTYKAICRILVGKPTGDWQISRPPNRCPINRLSTRLVAAGAEWGWSYTWTCQWGPTQIALPRGPPVLWPRRW